MTTVWVLVIEWVSSHLGKIEGMAADLPADIQIQIARIGADATIQAAQIAAQAARVNAIITAAGTVML